MKYIMLECSKEELSNRAEREAIKELLDERKCLSKAPSKEEELRIQAIDNELQKFQASVLSDFYGEKEIFNFMLDMSSFNSKSLEEIYTGSLLKKKIKDAKDNEYLELTDEEWKFFKEKTDHDRYFKLVKDDKGNQVQPLSSSLVERIASLMNKVKLAPSKVDNAS